MSYTDFFDAHPVFRYGTLVSYIKKQGNMSLKACRQQLNYYHKTGRIINIRRHLYALTPKENGWVDPYLIAAHAVEGSIIGYHSALELHQLAYSTFTEFFYQTTRSQSPFSFQQQQYRCITLPKSLTKSNKVMFGVDKMRWQGMDIVVTGLERTIVDVLDRPDLAGGWEEVIRSLDHITHFDVDMLIEYTLLLNKRSLAAKVGYFLDQLPDALAVDPKALKQLKKYLPAKPYYLEPSDRGKGKGIYVAKWQLIVPKYLAHRAWEESSFDDA